MSHVPVGGTVMSFSAPGSPPPNTPDQPPSAVPPMPPVPPQAQPYPQHAYPAQPAYPGQPAYPYPHPNPYPAPPPPGIMLRSPHGLATALTVLLSIAGVAALLLTGIRVYLWSLMDGLVKDPLKVKDIALARVDNVTAVADGLQGMLWLATAIVFVMWFHRVRQNGQVFRPDAFTLAPGWAIGAWFVPLANLVMPFTIARQTWTASTQLAPDGSFRKVSSAPVTAWWLAFAGSQLTDSVFGVLYSAADTPEQLRGAAVVGAVSGLLTVAAAVLAVLFVRKLTALQSAKAAHGPYAAA
ncbi:hypothetical protein EES37_22170 [Streptomyces sp. ADI91-18]|nr:hypothetical protein EES37_22170 [Streptomyces sp. ADI91-18]